MLTLQGVSTNISLEMFNQYIIQGTYKGLEGLDLDGNIVQMFLDISKLLEDRPVSYQVSDVLNHVASVK